MGGSRGGGEAGGPDPRKITSYKGLYREKTIGPPPPPWKKLDPLGKWSTPLEPWKMIVVFESNHWTSVK